MEFYFEVELVEETVVAVVVIFVADFVAVVAAVVELVVEPVVEVVLQAKRFLEVVTKGFAADYFVIVVAAEINL